MSFESTDVDDVEATSSEQVPVESEVDEHEAPEQDEAEQDEGEQAGDESSEPAQADASADTQDGVDGVDGVDGEKAEDSEEDRLNELEAEGDIAADYLEELLDIADLDGDLDMDVEGDRAAVSIVGADLQQLVGRDGEVLDALQELTRLAVYRETGVRSRLMLDISGFRADKRTQLVELAAQTVATVRETGEPVSLSPMSPFERKVVHDAVAEAGLTSESEGAEPRRHVVVLPV